jgi:hypothetical protein
MTDHLSVGLGRRANLDPSSPAARLLRAFLNGRKPETITAYRQDLEDFQAFIQAPTIEQAASLLLARGPGGANALALDYKAHLMDRHLSANTINRRLTALRSLVKLGRTLGLCLLYAGSSKCEVQSVPGYPRAGSSRLPRHAGRPGQAQRSEKHARPCTPPLLVRPWASPCRSSAYRPRGSGSGGRNRGGLREGSHGQDEVDPSLWKPEMPSKPGSASGASLRVRYFGP